EFVPGEVGKESGRSGHAGAARVLELRRVTEKCTGCRGADAAAECGRVGAVAQPFPFRIQDETLDSRNARLLGQRGDLCADVTGTHVAPAVHLDSARGEQLRDLRI